MTRGKSRDKNSPHRTGTTPVKQTGDQISDRNNNNINIADPTATEPDVERANDRGLGDAGINHHKTTKYRSNRSKDA